MFHLVLLLRRITVIAALGSAIGAILIFGVGYTKLAHAMDLTLLPSETGGLSITALVMQATDAFLFGLVLIVVAYGITFGFAFSLPEAARAKLPQWMQVGDVTALRTTLTEVVLVYVVVDFATDVVKVETHVTWDLLVKPVSVLLIAGALRLVGTGHSESRTKVKEDSERPTHLRGW
jgi:uncharacterized membrane protein YqhA